MAAPEKILVRGLNWLGDAIMATPALIRLRQARPAAHITLLSPAKLGALWDGQPYFDNVITFSGQESVWKVGGRLRREKFSAAVAFPNSFRSALELWLAGVPQRIGLARGGRGLLLTHSLPARPGAVRMRKRSDAEVHELIEGKLPPADIFPPSAHHIHDYLYLTSALGASLEPLPPRIFVDDEKAMQLCAELGLDGAGTWFGLNPGAEYGPAKRWPVERFVAAAKVLEKEWNCRWVIFGGPADAPMAAAIAREVPKAVDLAGRTTLPQLAAALKLCNVVLTNDTGPMHLASAVGTPVVVPFGSTSPELTGPIFCSSAQIVRNSPPCAPCFRRECPVDLRCLTAIDSSAVVAAARRALSVK